MPRSRYAVSDRIRLEDEIVDVIAVRRGGNPRQGSFSVIDVRTARGEVRRLAAEVATSKTADSAASFRAPSSSRPWEGPSETTSTLFGRRVLGDYWGAPVPPEAASAYRAVRAIWEPTRGGDEPDSIVREAPKTKRMGGGPSPVSREAGRHAALGSAETWWRLVEPALRVLGWWAAPLPDGAGHALYADIVSRDVAVSRTGQGGSPTEGALALLVSVPEGEPLGRPPGGDVAPGISPALELVGMMLSEGVAWGLLTNGREWRLYRTARGDADVGSTLEEYHRADLTSVSIEARRQRPGERQQALEHQTPGDDLGSAAAWEAFSRWFTVFRARAFVPDNDGQAPVERLKRKTASYASNVVDHLRQQVLETVLPEIAGGFIVYRAEELGAASESEETLAEIRAASLGLIYRMLFVLHAESRGLLPIDNPDYRGQSLTTLLHWAREAAAGDLPASRTTHITPRYDAVLALFHRLEHGAPALGLPSYGCGLFNPVDRDVGFLEGHRLSDRAVARALAALDSVEGEPVDYTALSYRHLSAVGEGLLGNSLWVIDRAVGQVALVNDRGEPHVPASVPVPDFVGAAVIEQAILADLADREVAFARAMDQVASLRRELEDEEYGNGAVHEALAAAEDEARVALLDVRVLDPAMGTGTFLVWAIDVLVDGVAKVLFTYHRSHPWVPWSWDPVAQVLMRTRQGMLDEADRQGVVVDPDRLEDSSLLARLITERAIYGVDVNATAVSVSRATVTMRAFAVGAPFVSLGQHLRQRPDVRQQPDVGRGDSLAEVRSRPWNLAFPEVFSAPAVSADEQTGFDLVIGSPPAGAVGPGEAFGGDSAFLSQARRLVRRPGGRVALVMIPSSQG